MRRHLTLLVVSIAMLTCASSPALAARTLWFNAAGRVFPTAPTFQSVQLVSSGAAFWPRLTANGYTGDYFLVLDVPSDAVIDSVIFCYQTSNSQFYSLSLASIHTGSSTLATGNLSMSSSPTRGAFDVPDVNSEGALSIRINCVVGVGGIDLFAVGLKLKDVAVSVGDDPVLAPGQRLDAPSPNPFHENVAFRFTLTRPGRAEIAVFDVGGRRVRTFDTGALEAGDHTIAWDGRDDAGARVASGVYYYELATDWGRQGRKVIMVR